MLAEEGWRPRWSGASPGAGNASGGGTTKLSWRPSTAGPASSWACAAQPPGPGAPGKLERCLAAGSRGIGEIAFYLQDHSRDLKYLLAPGGRALPALPGAPDDPRHRPGRPDYPGRPLTPLAAFHAVIKEFPETTWILAHWGGRLPFYGLLKKEAPEIFRHVYFDTAASPYIFTGR